MFCPRSLSDSKKLPVLGFSVLLVIVSALPSFAADKVRVAFSAVSPSQGVLWVAEVSGLLPKNGISAEIVYTRAAIETLVAGEVDFGQMTGSLMSSARLQGADPVMIAGVQDTLDDRLWRVPISNPWKISGENGSAFSALVQPRIYVDLRAAALRLERSGRFASPDRR